MNRQRERSPAFFLSYGELREVPRSSGRLKSVEECEAYEIKNHPLCGWAIKVIQLHHLSNYNRVVQATKIKGKVIKDGQKV